MLHDHHRGSASPHLPLALLGAHKRPHFNLKDANQAPLFLFFSSGHFKGGRRLCELILLTARPGGESPCLLSPGTKTIPGSGA